METEKQTRILRIDKKLEQSGWKVVKYDASKDLTQFNGCAVEEYKTYYIMYRINKKQFRKNIGKVSKTVALQMLKKFEEDLSLHNVGLDLPKRIGFNNFYDEYLICVENNQSRKTFLGKRSGRNFISHFISKILRKRIATFEIQEINQAFIEKYKNYQITLNQSPRTINLSLDLISNILRKADEWGYIISKVKITKLKEPKKLPRFFSQEEVELLFNNSSNYLKQIITILFYTGMRISELLNLQWKHIDFESNFIRVSNTNTFTTKSGKDRSIPINSTLRAYLLELKEIYIKSTTDEIYERKRHQRKYIICHEDGRKLNGLGKSFRKLLNRLNIKNARIHTLRHTFASHCVMNGIDLYTVKEFLGHKDIQTTMIYSHLSDNHKKQAIEKLVLLPSLIGAEMKAVNE